jgi:hypothetical protein
VINADPEPIFNLVLIQIRILLLIKVMRTCVHGSIVASKADMEPTFHSNADPDPQTWIGEWCRHREAWIRVLEEQGEEGRGLASISVL